MEFTKEFFSESKIISEGTTSYILQHKTGIVCKLYKGAVDYIFKNGDYLLDEKDVFNRLKYILSKKNDVILTDLPNEILIYDGKPVGVVIEYYENSITLKDFFDNNDIEIEKIKNKVIEIVEELIENGIVPTDPHFENFLVSFDEDGNYSINMVDIDDNTSHFFSIGMQNFCRGLPI